MRNDRASGSRILHARAGVLMRASLFVLLALTATAAAQPPPPSVPLRVGLTVVTAINSEKGDYESIKRITAITDKGVTLSYTADNPPGRRSVRRR